ncbi:hypothetical protein K3495_g10032 [Podosphaera aphanis]|nr:hypothetical protein K3495_g10032 [Podosphaera aphanis]
MDSEPAKIRVPRANYARYAHAIAQWVHPPPILDTIEKVEAYAQELCFQLSNAIKATGTRIGKGSEYQTATAPSQRDTCAKVLRMTISAAKKEYQTRRVKAMTTPADIYKLMRSSKPKQAETPPSLKHNGKLITNPAKRAAILRDALLTRHQASDDLPPCTTPSDNRIPWTERSLRRRSGCGNTSPGADGVSVELLETCWKTIGPYVTDLFRACTNLGTWRPIALLSCLGKGLERPPAKRMAHLAMTYDVVGSQQFGALPKRSATDLVSCVVHDIGEARAVGWAEIFVTLDVQGAFDAVLHNRLIRRMREQGWPDQILRWTSSFLANRRVRVRYTGGVTMERELVCSVSQGSPISPLLFLLYMAEPMRSGHAELRFSYADDVGILGFGPTVAESAAAAQREVDHLLAWARNNAVTFDTNKSEVIQFTKHRHKSPTNISINGTIIEPAEHIQWLGVYLDTRLTFKHHVSTWCGEALKAAHILRRLNSTHRGAAPAALGATSCTSCLKTTPTVVVQREGGIPPEKILSEANRLRLAARLQTLDDCLPLRGRAVLCPNTGTRKYKKKSDPVQETRVPDLGRKKAKLESFKKWITSIPSFDICAYSDGSSEGHGRSSWGFVLQREGKTFASGNGIKHGGEVFDAEITGARKALEAALRVGGRSQHIHLLFDSQQAAKALATGSTKSSLKEVLNIRALTKENIRIQWVPGYSGIQGNEEADALARAALRDLPHTDSVPEKITLGYL